MMRLRGAITAGLTLSGWVIVLVLAAGGSAHASNAPTPEPHTSTPVESGYAQNEDFCAQRPLHGRLNYRVSAGNATMQVNVRGLPSKTLMVIDWANNTVRGYQVGTIRTNKDGAMIPASLNLSRSGETHGYKIVLTTTAIDPRSLGTLWPCSPPSDPATANVADPRVTVTPATGLSTGQRVKVSVTGFGESRKVFLSECDYAEDASGLGCGPQIAAQPFIVTGTNRSGSTTFVVQSSAASKPYDFEVTPCTNLCVIVAAQGDGAWAVARVAFGSSHLITPQGG